MRPRITILCLIVALALGSTACGPSSLEEIAEHGTPVAAGAPGVLPDILDISVATVDGRAFDPRELAGRPVLVWFYDSACDACRTQAVEAAIHSELHPGQLHFLGVARPAPQARLQEFVRANSTAAFHHVVDEEGRLRERFDVGGDNTYVLVDGRGGVVFRETDPDPKLLDQAIDALIPAP